MEESTRSSRLIRFGAFEVDLRSGELRKDGRNLKLHGQPFQVLAALLEKPGELVTREELQKKLWPDDTFVDFDHSLNTAINKIRETLGDSAENPCFIETLPRRGYRLIAQVDRAVASASTLAPGSRRLWLAMAAGLAAFVLVGLAYLLTRPLPPPRVLRTTQITNDGKPKFLGPFFGSGPILTDGSRLHFAEFVGGRIVVAQVSASGGETALISSSLSNALPLDISPSGSELLVLSLAMYTETESALWVVPTLAGSPRRLGNVLAHDAAWLPDGQKIAYANGADLFLVNSDGTDPRKMVTTNGRLSWPRWSPGGTLLRFTLYDSKTNSNSLWEASPDGKNLHPLLPGWNNPAAECCGNWTPDGRYYLFHSTRDNVTSLWAMREKEGLFEKPRRKPIQLTTGPTNIDVSVPSKDGKKLFVGARQPRGELVRYDPKSGQFVPYLGGISAVDVDFSRDGEWAAYRAFPVGSLWRSRVDGREQLQLTFLPMRVWLPRWSPDGKRIVFSAQTPGKPWKIYLVASEGGTPQQLIPGKFNEIDPGWSPDGNSLVFGGHPQFESGPSGTMAIHIVDMKTNQVSTLPGSEGLYSPIWSPDGRYIVAMPGDSLKLVLFDFATKKWSHLVKMNIGYPSWSRGGRFVYFDSPLRTDPAFYRVRIRDRKVERLISLRDFRLGDFWSGLAPDDSPLLLRDASIQEIYVLDWEAP